MFFSKFSFFPFRFCLLFLSFCLSVQSLCFFCQFVCLVFFFFRRPVSEFSYSFDLCCMSVCVAFFLRMVVCCMFVAVLVEIFLKYLAPRDL